MKTFILTLAAASAIAAAALPAAAQPYGDFGREGFRERPIAQGDNLAWRIDHAEREGRIGHRMADRLRDQLRVADRLAWAYRRDGVITRPERIDLDRRYAYVADSLRGWRQSQDGPYGGRWYGDRDFGDRGDDYRR
jgi:hypothetical protein